MAAQIPVVAGGISYQAPTFNYGTTQSINGGYSFDLPLATVAQFTNTALTFSAQNTANAQGFFSGVLGQAQGALTNVNNQSFAFQDKSLLALQDMYSQQIGLEKYKVKKKYGLGNMLKPGSGCFITTAVCKASGKSDNCFELQLLRKFRDEYLLTLPGGKLVVDVYYQIAPAIVAALDASSMGASHYAYLKCNFIDRCIQLISTGEYAAATDTYACMLEVAAKLAGIESLPVVVGVPTTEVVCTCKGGKRAANFHAKSCPVRNPE